MNVFSFCVKVLNNYKHNMEFTSNWLFVEFLILKYLRNGIDLQFKSLVCDMFVAKSLKVKF